MNRRRRPDEGKPLGIMIGLFGIPHSGDGEPGEQGKFPLPYKRVPLACGNKLPGSKLSESPKPA